MACEVAPFLEQFPGAVDVVSREIRAVDRGAQSSNGRPEGVRVFLRRRRHLPFEQLLDEFQECQPCAVSGTLQVSLLYGREHGLYLDDNATLKMDVKGLGFKKP